MTTEEMLELLDREFPHYDRLGLPIRTREFIERKADPKYVRVAATQIGPVEVSTVWVGIDMAPPWRKEPLIFETMIFGGPDEIDHWCRRYSTEEEARAGHERGLRARTRVSTIGEVNFVKDME